MHLRDLVFIVVDNLRRMKLRLALTTLGVVIGTSAIVLMLSLGIGLQRNVTQSLGELGAATHVQVMGGMTSQLGESKALDKGAIEDMRELEHVVDVMPQVMAQSQDLRYKRQSAYASVMGVPIESLETFGYTLADGRWPRNDKEIVLGASVPAMFLGLEPGSESDAGPGLDLVGKRIVATFVTYPETPDAATKDTGGAPTEIDRKLTVVGVLEKLDMQTDSSAFVPLTAALEFNDQDTRRPTYENAVVKVDSTEAVADVEKTLTDMGYMTFSARSIQKGLSSTFLIIQGVLGALGAIAMIVAALGIANTMTMSIYERTREIGVMKAVGASNRQIKRVFLGEAAIIGVLGGIGGLVFSAGGAALANLFVQSMIASQSATAGGGMPENTTFFVIPVWLAAFAIAFAAGVGLLAGVLPAVRAANLDPLIALRHE